MLTGFFLERRRCGWRGRLLATAEAAVTFTVTAQTVGIQNPWAETLKPQSPPGSRITSVGRSARSGTALTGDPDA
jgi:hypothetical protein